MLSLDHNFEKRLPATHRLMQAVATLREYRGKEELFRRQTPQMLESLRQTAMIESVESSNRIEGVVAAKGRVRNIVQEMSEPRDRSEAEIAGYRDVLDTIHGSHENIRLTNGTVLQFHRELFARTDVRGGRWKSEQNAIVRTHPDGSQEIRFQPPPAHLTDGLMVSLNEAARTFAQAHKADELLVIAAYVLDFLCIHPFPDGNGRMARLLTLLMLYQAGFGVGRFISLERIIEQSKETYYESLHASSQGWIEGRHDLTPWTEYLLGTITAAYRQLEDRVAETTSARGAKTRLIDAAIDGAIGDFTAQDILAKCPSASLDMVRHILKRRKALGDVESLGRGRTAKWRRIR